MKRKSLIGLLVALVAVVATLYFGIGTTEKTEVSADEAAAQPAPETNLLFLDDEVSAVNEGQDLSFKIKVDLLAGLISQKKKSSVGIDPIVGLLRGPLGIYKKKLETHIWIKAYLASGKRNGQWILEKPSYQVKLDDFLKDKDLQAVTLTVGAQAPTGIALDNNELISNAFLFEKRVTCKRYIIGKRCHDKWIKIAEATDRDVLNYTNPLTDLGIVSFASSQKILAPRVPDSAETTFNISYQNAGKSAASNTVLKLRLPEKMFDVAALEKKDFSLTSETIDNAKYDVLVWNLGNLAGDSTGNVSIKVKALRQDQDIVKATAQVEISTSSEDPGLENNKKSLTLVIVSSRSSR